MVVGGTEFSGMSMIVVTPPRAAAVVAVANPSHSVRPGSLTCTWVSTTPGSSRAVSGRPSVPGSSRPSSYAATSVMRPSSYAATSVMRPSATRTVAGRKVPSTSTWRARTAVRDRATLSPPS